jgi:superfamily II DNA/RNA helicase
LLDALARMEITEPTEIQSRAIRVVVSGGGRGGGGGPEEVSTGSSSAAAATNVFIASHTGSGKTLAYLLPGDSTHESAAETAAGERLAKPKRPKVIVDVPDARSWRNKSRRWRRR